ncbi:hypothetical protein [Desulfosarcina widdelii]|nr:hypothetical protein [Desulfosarcina widdelii]
MLRICKNCQSPFRPHYKVPNQKYCSSDTCQKARRNDWQRQKRHNDDDYKKNQDEAQKNWSSKNSDYWGKYRDEHPEYVERNKRLQKKRYVKAAKARIHDEANNHKIAKMDYLIQKSLIKPGYYILYPADPDNIAKMDPLLVKIEIIAVA